MLNLYNLEPGVVYIVTKPFEDHYRQRFEAGTKLTFVGKHFLPYHGGHTVVFRERSIYLQEDDERHIIAALHEYLAPYDLSGRIRPPLLKWDELPWVLFCLLVLAGGVWMVYGGGSTQAGWACVVFGGLGAALVTANMIGKWW